MSCKVEEISFESSNCKNRVQGKVYTPREYDVRAVVLIAHGMAEHIDRYDEFMQFLGKNGFASAIIGHIGHKYSIEDDSQLGYFAEESGYMCLVKDIDQLHLRMRQQFPEKPIFLLGHSMGSFVMRLYCEKYKGAVQGLLLVGTGYINAATTSAAITLSKLVAAVKGETYRSKLIDKVAFGNFDHKFKNGKTSMQWLCSEQSVVDDYLADPYCGFLFTAKGYQDLFTLIQKTNRKEWFSSLNKNMPVLLVSGSMDPVGDYGKGVNLVYDRLLEAGQKEVDIQLYPGGRHEILNETNRYEVYADIVAWLERYL